MLTKWVKKINMKQRINQKNLISISLILFILIVIPITTYVSIHSGETISHANTSKEANSINKEDKRLRRTTEETVASSTLTKQTEGLLANIRVHQENKDKTAKAVADVLAQRKEKIVSLMKDDPAAAIDSLLSDDNMRAAQAISPDNTEKKVDLTGTYTLLHIHGNDFSNPEEEQNFDLLTAGQTQYTLYSDSSFAKISPGDTITISGYQFGDSILATSVTASPSHSKVKGVSTASTLNIAVIGTKFTDTPTAQDYTLDDLKKIFTGSLGNDVTSYYNEVSYGSLTVNVSYYGIYTLSYTRSVGCADNQLEQKIVNTADPDINYSQFNRIIFVQDCNGYFAGAFPTLVTADGTFSNLYFVGANSVGIKDSDMPQVITHEIAHTLGSVFGGMLYHANYYNCLPDSFDSPTNFGLNFGLGCTSIAYGDVFDVLGQAGLFAHLNAYHKHLAGFFVPSNYNTVSTSGTYTIAPIEQNTSALQGIYIPRGTNGNGFTVEYRQPIGFDARFINNTLCPGCTETLGPSVRFIRMEKTGETQGIDTTPLSSSRSSETGDYANGAALTPGNTFTDADYGITIKTLSASASGATFEVTVPTQTCTHNTPTVSVSPQSQSGTFTDTKNYTVSVKNNDTAGCQPVLFGGSFPFSNSNLTYLLNPSYLTLAPGATGTMTLSVTPKGAAIGTQNLSFYIMSNPVEVPNVNVSIAFVITTPPDTIAPSAPIDLTGTALGSTQIKLTWTEATDDTGVVGYNVFRDGNKISTVTSPTFIDPYLYQNITYSYYVQPFDRAGNTVNSNTVAVTTPAKTDYTLPSCYSNFKVTTITSPTSFTMSWSASSDNVGITTYNIVRDRNVIAVLPSTATSFTDTLPMYSTKYSYLIYAYDGDGNNTDYPCEGVDPLVFYTGTAGNLPPKQPTGLQGTGVDPGTIHLTWNANTEPNISGYNVYESGTKLATITGTSFDDTGLTGNHYYFYTLQAFDTQGNRSSFTPQILVLTPAGSTTPTPTPTSTPTTTPSPTPTPTPDSTPPSTPTNLTASVGSATSVNLSWTTSTDNVGVTGYWVVRNGVTLTSVTTTAYTDNSVSPNTTYQYQVSAFDAAGNISLLTAPVSVTTPALPDTTPPSTPTNLTGSAISSSQINLSWTASTDNVGVVGYDIYRNNNLLTSVTPTSFGDTSLTASTNYSYFVKARDAAGNVSNSSNTVTVTTQSPPATTGSITGTVYSNRGGVISGAKVATTVNGAKQTYTTNSSGLYSIPNLKAGNYTLKFSAQNYLNQQVTVNVVSGSSTIANVTMTHR